MLRAVLHDVKYFADERCRNGIVEKVGHAVHKNGTRFFPAAWLVQSIFVSLYFDEFSITPEAFCYAFRVTVFAPGRNFRAARHWVPRHFRPFDCRNCCHMSIPLFSGLAEEIALSIVSNRIPKLVRKGMMRSKHQPVK